jgi:hypothetical protein
MIIIEIEALANGAHRSQSWEGATPLEGYVAVPAAYGKTLEEIKANLPTWPFVDVEVSVGSVTITAGITPEPDPEPHEEKLTLEDIAEAMIDLQVKVINMEMGVT